MSCNYFLQDITNDFDSNNFIISRIHYMMYIDKFFKFVNHIRNFLKFRVLLLTSSLQVIGLEHKNSLACPHCNITESHNISCLLGPLRQPLCEPVWIDHPCLRILLVSAPGTSLHLLQCFLLQWPANTSIAWTGWNLPLPLQDFEPGGNLRCHLSWKAWILHPSNLNQFENNKIVRIYVDIYQSPQSWCNRACSRNN